MKANAEGIAKRIGTIYPGGSEVVMTLAEQFREEGKKEGKAEGKSEVVRNAVREGMELRLIEKLTGLSKKEIEKIAAEEMEEYLHLKRYQQGGLQQSDWWKPSKTTIQFAGEAEVE